MTSNQYMVVKMKGGKCLDRTGYTHFYKATGYGKGSIEVRGIESTADLAWAQILAVPFPS